MLEEFFRCLFKMIFEDFFFKEKEGEYDFVNFFRGLRDIEFVVRLFLIKLSVFDDILFIVELVCFFIMFELK